MRGLTVFLLLIALAFSGQGATPELGKDALRKLVKLPTITFEPTWAFDDERGFSLGSQNQDAQEEIGKLRKLVKQGSADAENYLRLGELYFSLNDPVNARKNWSRAADLFRSRVESQPNDGLLLAHFGEALEGAGKMAEAESALRDATRLARGEWKCWLTFGRLLDAQTRETMVMIPLTSDKMALARRKLTEADECFDKAASLAPENGRIFFQRALHRCRETALVNDLRIAEGQSADEVLAHNNRFSEAALKDLKHASALEPGDYSLLGNAVLFEIYVSAGRNGRVNWTDFSWSTLPEEAQNSLREGMTRLESLGHKADSRQAAGALEVLGILQGPILHEPGNCAATLRRALAFDPSREKAWEALAAALAQTGRYDELLSTCEDRVRQKESVRSHLLLAKAFEKLHQWDDSENEIMQALRLGPNDFSANLAEAALVLRRGQDDDAFSEANSWLARSERLLGETPATQRTTQLIVDLTLTRSIYFALTDQLDEARQWAKAVISLDKNNNRAHDILSAMDY